MDVRSPGSGKAQATIQTCLTMKALFGSLLRYMSGFVQSLLRPVGLVGMLPDFKTRYHRRRTLNVNPPLAEGKVPAEPAD